MDEKLSDLKHKNLKLKELEKDEKLIKKLASYLQCDKKILHNV